MKIINYNYGYMPEFNCSIHGRILVTPEENKKILNLLLAWNPGTSYPHLKEIALKEYRNYGRYNVRVSATEYLADNMPHTGKLKRANYFIEVLPERRQSEQQISFDLNKARLEHLPSTRLEYLRGEIEAERISYAEVAELRALAKHIEPGDNLLLQWAGVPEGE